MIASSALKSALGVNAQARCDCSGVTFEVGIAVADNGNNFVRILECTACRKQMPMVHRSDAQLAPSLAS